MEFSEAKVGDEIYSTGNIGMRTISIQKITRVTKTMIFIGGGKNLVGEERPEIKISMNGEQIGTKGTGRYGSFSVINWYRVTDQIRLEYNIQKMNRGFKSLGEKISNLQATPEHFDAYNNFGENLAAQLTALLNRTK
jgi:hypothetical protein